MTALLVALVVVAVAAITGWWVTHGEQSDIDRDGDRAASATSPTAAELEALGVDVTSGSRPRVKAAFGIPAAQRLDPDFLAELDSWRDLEMDASSYEPVGDKAGTVTATLHGAGRSTQWHVTVRRTGGSWHILTTEPRG